METRKRIFMSWIMLFLFAGCGYGVYFVHSDPNQEATEKITTSDSSDVSDDLIARYYYTTSSPDPVILTFAEIEKKKIYIQNAKETLQHFHRIAHDIHKRKDVLSTEELGREANIYIKAYVEPVLNDPEAFENSETRAEMARLYLLSSSLYYELDGYYQAKYYLKQLTDRFGIDFLSGISVEQTDTGFNTVAEGVDYLQKKISLKQIAKTAKE